MADFVRTYAGDLQNDLYHYLLDAGLLAYKDIRNEDIQCDDDGWVIPHVIVSVTSEQLFSSDRTAAREQENPRRCQVKLEFIGSSGNERDDALALVKKVIPKIENVWKTPYSAPLQAWYSRVLNGVAQGTKPYVKKYTYYLQTTINLPWEE